MAATAASRARRLFSSGGVREIFFNEEFQDDSSAFRELSSLIYAATYLKRLTGDEPFY